MPKIIKINLGCINFLKSTTNNINSIPAITIFIKLVVNNKLGMATINARANFKSNVLFLIK